MTSPTHADPAQSLTPICAIGASAGGVAALQQFFSAVRNDLGVAFAVVVHLPPDMPSQLSEIVQTRTSMRTQQVAGSTHMEPNCVYIIPPDRELVIRGNDIEARPFTAPRGHRAPIDMFFRSVADGRGDGVAIILSGSGSDGALGARAIKEAGGIILAQEPDEAEFSMMPRSVIATGVVDFVAPIAQLTQHLSEVLQSKESLRLTRAEDAEREIQQILTHLRKRTGHDFSSYKPPTVMRRIARRMQVTRQKSLMAYRHYLQTSQAEVKELLSDLLISVTMFFRDRNVFEVLAQQAVKPLFDRLEDEGSIRVWVIGCATGEEAYSLGILLMEEASRRHLQPSIQIFASDLDEGAIATAREGRYPDTIEADVSEERLKRFFTHDGQHYQVRQELRDRIMFAVHNVLKDPPFIKLDLISCRNLLIYFQRELQHQLYSLFHYALKPNGVLMLGTAETVDATPELFNPIDRGARIYAARPVANKVPPVLPQLVPEHRIPGYRPPSTPRIETAGSIGRTHASALEDLAPPSVLVDSSHCVLHLSPSVGQFFKPSEGPFTAELPALVRPELRVDLNLALRRAMENGETTLTLPVPVAFNGQHHIVAMHVTPVKKDEGESRALVFFLDAGEAKQVEEALTGEVVSQEEFRRLRQELSVAHNRLDVIHHDHEQAMQELRAANEELQSINEEYRSTAEELETSKEELQSMNEELQTVNAELKSKLEVITAAHNDLRNLMAATDIGTLFLDMDLKIKLFTPAATTLFNITNTDIGRVISDFTHRLKYESMEQDTKQVLSTLVPVAKEVESADKRWFMMRLRPYRTIDNRIEGVVATFSDITTLKATENALTEELRAAIRVHELSTRVAETGTLEQPLHEVLDAVMELLDADSGHVQLYDEQKKVLRICVQQGFAQQFLDRFQEVDASEGSACGLALGNGLPILIEDVDKQAASVPSPEEVRAAGIRAIHSTPLVTITGKVVGMMSTYFRKPRKFSTYDLRRIDICARQAADAIHTFILQQSLRESETRLRKVLETETVGVLFFDNAGTLTDCNDAFLKMSGYSRDEVAARQLSWRIMTPPEWMAISEEQIKKLEKTGVVGPYEKEYYCKDGSRRWMLFAGQRIESNLIAEYAIDISRRKKAELGLQESEKRLRMAIQAGRMATWEWDIKLGKSQWNDEHYTMLGYEVGEVEPGYSAWKNRLHPEDRERAEAVVSSAISEHREYANEYRILCPDGTIRWLSAYGLCVYDDEGEPVRMIGLLQDITEAKEARHAQDVLVAELQHRTRNLIAVVQSIAQQTLKAVDNLDEFGRQFGQRLETLSRAQALLSRADADHEPVTFAALVNMELEALGNEHLAEKATIAGPEVQLRRKAVQTLALAIHELATNARKHGAFATDSGRLSVTWRIEGRHPEKRLVLDWIETGIVAASAKLDQDQHGYGRRLIEEGLPYSLSAKTKLELTGDTLRCSISLPLSKITDPGE